MKNFKICYVSPEVSPFAGEGEMARTSQLLPVALKETDQDIRLMMPKYKSINERKYVLREVIRLREVKVEVCGNLKLASGKTAFLPNSKVHVYFLSVPDYFDRKGLYEDPRTGEPYPDNAERFAYFCTSVLETLKLLYWQPDVIHCHGWPTALIPYYLKTRYQGEDFFRNTRTVLTIYDFQQQGIFPPNVAPSIGIAEEHAAAGGAFEFEGKLNFLKAGLLFADVLNTVSEHQAQRLLEHPEMAAGLGEVLLQRKEDFMGIMGGADYSTWNPESDPHLPVHFDAKSLEKKQQLRDQLCRELELTEGPSTPVIAFIGELTPAYGLDLLMEAIEEVLKLKARFIIVNEGSETEYAAQLSRLAREHPGKLFYQQRHDRRMMHVILAAADMLLLPCNQPPQVPYHLYAMRYGTVPVVRAVGSLADAIKAFDPEIGKGTGFRFEDYTKTALIKTLRTAINIFKDEKLWAKIQKAGMKADFSWGAVARRYLKLYEKAARK